VHLIGAFDFTPARSSVDIGTLQRPGILAPLDDSNLGFLNP
jgi:hypothetical protein